jgi:endonuclease YncB( thermonuclease family)
MNLKHYIIYPALALILAACGGTTSSALPSLTPADLNTAQTDALKLTHDYTGKDFIANGIGEVTLRSVTDGDTARFNVGNTNIALRFLGVNTPESTGQIQPWGNAASEFVKTKLTTATKIVLINDVPTFGLTDSVGSRYLGFIWYQPSAGADLRLLNLEIVEQAYSENLLFTRSDYTDYFDAFQAGGDYARRTGARIYGFRNDPTFDYSDNVYDVSIRFIRESFGQTVPLKDKYGEVVLDDNDEPIMFTLTNSTKLRLQVVVVGTIGSNALLRDVYDPDSNGNYASIFLFTLFRDLPFNTVGTVIELYAKSTTFNDNVQLTDPIMQTFHPFYPLRYITSPNDADYQEVLDLNEMNGNAEPFDLTDATITSPQSFAPYNGYFVSTIVTVRARPINPDDDLSGDVTLGDYFRKDTNNNMTIYGYYYGTMTSFNIRIDGRMFPYVYETEFAIGQSYVVTGYIAPFFDNYQIQLNNQVTVSLLQ